MENYKNYFAKIIYPPYDVLTEKKLDDIFRDTMFKLLRCYSLDNDDCEYFIKKLWAAKDSKDIFLFERIVKNLFNSKIKKNMKLKSLEKRALIICKQIENYIIGPNVADIGCGDGLVSYYLSKNPLLNYNYELFDIKNYTDNRVKFNFTPIKEDQLFEMKKIFSTVLLLTVLHHSTNPINVLNNAINISNNRIIIVESVYDIIKNGNNSPMYKLSKELQLKYAIFWDWFYNRIIQDNIQVPYNFQSPSNWIKYFKKLGLKIIHTENLGVDQNIVPEHHYLFILECSK